MASELGTSPPQSEPGAAASMEQPFVDLVIVSPSVAVPQPLRFPGTPASTTIKELKAKIRDAVPLHPTEENQRLIHRGRALVRDGDSLLGILGAEAIAADQQHTMHLVIRDVPTTAQIPPQPTPTTSQIGAARDPSPAPANGPQAQRPYAPSPQQQFLNTMQRRMLRASREAMSQTFVNHNQRGRAEMGMRGIGDNVPSQAARTESRDRGASPAPSTHTFRHETGPDGQTYLVETMRTSSASPGMSPADLQSLLQQADSSQATLTMTNAMNNAMQRSASSASMHNRPLNQPGVTVPLFPGPGSRAGSGRTTPFGMNSNAGTTQRPAQEVYILSSPEGPRALLVNNATAERYYTPQLSTRRSLPRMNNPGFSQMYPELQRGTSTATSYQPSPLHNARPLAYQQHPHTQHQQPPQYAQPQQAQQPPLAQEAEPQQQPPAPQAQAHMAHGLGHPQIHPPVAAIPPLLRMIWPHLWLIFRLSLFVWIFTSPGASWSRWMTVVGMAIFIFILSTGALNGVAEHVMRPVGRQLDNLLPALDDRQRRHDPARPAANQPDPAAAGQNGEQQTAQLAERLIDERQGRQGWFTGQFRRVERASLLFLASIAPGVAERHIAHIEAEAARERREAEEAARAAAEAAESANQPNETEDGNEAESRESQGGQLPEDDRPSRTDQDEAESGAHAQEAEPEAAAPEPLIAL